MNGQISAVVSLFNDEELVADMPWLPAVGLTWRYMYDPLYELVYQALDVLHLDQFFGGLGSVQWALFCVMIADIWQTTPFILLVVTASLATIPPYLYEAARIDGAGEFRIFFIITLPMLRNALIVLTVIRGVDAFRVFDTDFDVETREEVIQHLYENTGDARGDGLHLRLLSLGNKRPRQQACLRTAFVYCG